MPPYQSLALDNRDYGVGSPRLDLPLLDVDDPVFGNAPLLVEMALGDAISAGARRRDDLDHKVQRLNVGPPPGLREYAEVGDEEIRLDHGIGAERNVGRRSEEVGI